MNNTNEAQNTFKYIEAACGFVPVPALSSAAELLCPLVLALEALEGLKENMQCCNILVETALEIAKSMNDSAKEITKRGDKISTNLIHHINEFNNTLRDVVPECYKLMVRQSTLKRLRWQNRNKEVINGLIDRMRSAQIKFQDEILGISNGADTIRTAVEKYRKLVSTPDPISTPGPRRTPASTDYTHTTTFAPSLAPPPYSKEERQSIELDHIYVPSNSNVQNIGNYDITCPGPMVRVSTSGIVVGRGAIARNIGNVTTTVSFESQPGESN